MTVERMATPSFSRLAFVLTTRCSLRCRYCPVDKDNRSMAPDTLRRAIELFYGPGIEEIRTSGGDPLQRLDLLDLLLETLPPQSLLRLTTNGLGLNEQLLDRFDADPRIRLVASVDGTRTSHCTERQAASGGDSYAWFERYRARLVAFTHTVTLNVVIAPSQADRLVENIAYLAKCGFRRFNLLPAYYVEWSPEAIGALARQFDKLAKFWDGAWRRDLRLECVNMEQQAAQPLYTDALVIDTDGEIYDNDLITTRALSPDRHRFSLGNIHQLASINDLDESRAPVSWWEVLEARLGSDIMEATHRVDEQLTAFILRLQNLCEP